MRTEFLLLAQYDGQAALPLDVVCRDWFAHLTLDKFVRHLNAGSINLPIMRMGGGAKAHRMVHVNDLAVYLDAMREIGLKEARQMARAS